MTSRELKQQLDALLERLPEDKAELLLDYAAFLSQQSAESTEQFASDWDAWERAIIAAEDYWFSLPVATRQAYGSQTVAVGSSAILDADEDRERLVERVAEMYPDRPVLNIEAGAQRLSHLTLRSPRFN